MTTETPEPAPVLDWTMGRYGSWRGARAGVELAAVHWSTHRGNPNPWQIDVRDLPGAHAARAACATLDDAKAIAEHAVRAWFDRMGAPLPSALDALEDLATLRGRVYSLAKEIEDTVDDDTDPQHAAGAHDLADRLLELLRPDPDDMTGPAPTTRDLAELTRLRAALGLADSETICGAKSRDGNVCLLPAHDEYTWHTGRGASWSSDAVTAQQTRP